MAIPRGQYFELTKIALTVITDSSRPSTSLRSMWGDGGIRREFIHRHGPGVYHLGAWPACATSGGRENAGRKIAPLRGESAMGYRTYF